MIHHLLALLNLRIEVYQRHFLEQHGVLLQGLILIICLVLVGIDEALGVAREPSGRLIVLTMLAIFLYLLEALLQLVHLFIASKVVLQVLRQLVLLLVGLHLAGPGVRAHLVAQRLVQLLLQLWVLAGACFVGQPQIGFALAVWALLLLQNQSARPRRV